MEDVLHQLDAVIQTRYLEKTRAFRQYAKRLEHAHRRRPPIYVDFNGGVVERRGAKDITLPRKLFAEIFEFQDRHEWVDLIDFLLLPRSKRKLGRRESRDPRSAFSKAISDLRQFLKANHLPIAIVESRSVAGGLSFTAEGVSSNVGVALELAELGHNRMERGDIAGAIGYAKQALKIDPDSHLAAILVACVAEVSPSTCDLYESVIRSQTHFTRQMLRLANSIDSLRKGLLDDAIYKAVLERAHSQLSRPRLYLPQLWCYHGKMPTQEVNAYPKLLHLIARYALQRIEPPNESTRNAFRELVAIGEIREILQSFSLRASQMDRESVFQEVELRFWRLLAVDGWVPNCLDITCFADALRQAISSRFRFENSPDGAGRIPTISDIEKFASDEEDDENEDNG